MRKTFAKVEESLKIGHFYKHFLEMLTTLAISNLI